MKEFSVEIRLRNNLLRRRRLDMGFVTARLAAEAIGIGYSLYVSYETLHSSPVRADGTWRASALHIARFFCVQPEELWPATVLSVKKPVSEREIGAPEIARLLASQHPLLPDQALEEAERAQDMAEHVDDLPGQLPRIVRARWYEDKSAAEIAAEFEVTPARIHQQLQRAVSILRRDIQGLGHIGVAPPAPDAGRFCPIFRTIAGQRVPCVHKLRHVEGARTCPRHGNVEQWLAKAQ